jgi:hypothetical protein
MALLKMMTYRNTVWRRIIRETTKLLKEAHGRGLAFQCINEEMIEDFEGESSSRTCYTGRKQSCVEELRVLLRFRSTALTP